MLSQIKFLNCTLGFPQQGCLACQGPERLTVHSRAVPAQLTGTDASSLGCMYFLSVMSLKTGLGSLVPSSVVSKPTCFQQCVSYPSCCCDKIHNQTNLGGRALFWLIVHCDREVRRYEREVTRQERERDGCWCPAHLLFI